MRVTRVATLAVWIASVSGATAMLWSLQPPVGLDPAGASVTTAFWLLRDAAVLAGVYLLSVTALGIVLRACRLHALARVADQLTVPLVRRLLAITTVAALTAAPAAGSASTGGEPPPVLVALPPDSPRPSPTAVAPPVLRRLDDIAPSPPTAGSPAARTTVARNDNLWVIAERTLRERWKRQPTVTEIAPYWHTVIEANRSRLRPPADPNLIYPGQQFDLPTPPPPS